MKRYLGPTEVEQVVQLRMGHQCMSLPEGLLCLPAQSEEHGGDF